MPIYVGVGGEHKQALDIWVGVGGQHKRVLQVWCGVGGQWKLTFVAGVINDDLPSGGAANTNAHWILETDGTYTISTELSGNWVEPANATIADFYEVKIDVTSATTFDSGSPTGTWLDSTSQRNWGLVPPSSEGSKVVTFTVSFREKGSGIVRSTQPNVQLEAITTS